MASRNATDYPRVLVISPHSFNLTDGGGIALTNYFLGWPADRIAQAHVFDAGVPADTSVCRTFYHLSGRELLPAPPILLYRAVKMWLFGRRHSPDMATPSGQVDAGPNPHLAKLENDERKSGMRPMLERVLVRHGFFSGVESQISPEFDKFVRDFGPEAVFAVPGDIAFAKLPRQVSERYDLPLVVQIADDWMTPYPTKHFVARATAAKLNRELTKTLRRAEVRYSISDAMSEAFRGRYGVDFETLVSPVDVGQWFVERPGDGRADGEKTVLYAGTIFEVAQLNGLIDISQAIARLNDASVACRLVISTPAIFIDRYQHHFWRPGTTMVSHHCRDDVMAHMADADLLVLPVEFDPKLGSFVRYSMPAKITAYMASGITIFVYGPNHAPPVAEARRYGFAHVLDRRDPDELDAALRRLFIDKEYRAGLAEKAVIRARENHDIEVVSERFRLRLRDAVAHASNSDRCPRDGSAAIDDPVATVSGVGSSPGGDLADTPVFTVSEVANRVRRDRGRLPRHLRIRCARTNAVNYREIVESLLWIGRCRSWQWVDGKGGVVDGQSPTRILARLALDALAWPWLYLRHRTVAVALRRSSSQTVLKRNPSRALYLRTDHVFDQTAGGSLTHTQGVIAALRGFGVRVDVVSTDRLRGVPVDGDFHGVEPVYGLGRNLPNIPELAYNDQLIRWLDGQWPRLTPDFIYQRSSRGNYTGALLSRRRKVPFVYEYNGSLVWVARHWGDKPEFHEKLLDSVELANLRTADLIVVVSEPLRQELLGRGLPDRKILVNPNGVDTDIFRPDIDGMPVRKKHGLDDRLVIGFIGSFGAWHGAEVLADAFGLLLQRWPQYRNRVRLLMIGDGQKMPLVTEALENHGVGEHCILTGSIPQEDGPSHLAACDILASPHVPNPDGSRFFGSPTKLFEYMAMGRGIVASDLEQIGEVLEHGHTGWLVEPGSAEALAEGLRVLIEDEPLRTRLGGAARRLAESQFTWQQHTQRIIDALADRCHEVPAAGRFNMPMTAKPQRRSPELDIRD